MPRYVTTGIPPGLASGSALGLSAFMPHFNRLAASGAQVYKGTVTGLPGTARIPMEPGRMLPPSDVNDIGLMGTARSSDAPDGIWPNQYYTNPVLQGPREGNERYWPGAGMPIQMYNPVRPQDTTMIPVPAVDLRTVYQARAALLSGGVAGAESRGQALKQFTNFMRWPQRRTGNGPGTGG
jgi:hypothetical protein